ncbi:uncharacterized protein LOC141703695 [Apium graveolens]|uniref:uncharacterized protein LOC141703695 n=1 Tax=Apium graveolens TaxID=4045 RepID=UPI003D7AF634
MLGVRLFARDEILWESQQGKEVNISKIWNSIRRIGQPPPWISAVWSIFSIPKNSFFFWLAIQDRLLTKERMSRFGMYNDGRCMLCNGHNENASHLFMECGYATQILQACPVTLTRDWRDFRQGNFLANTESNIKRQIAYLYIGTTIYYIWQERNRRMHSNGNNRSSRVLLFIIKREVREKLFSCKRFHRAVENNVNLITLLY